MIANVLLLLSLGRGVVRTVLPDPMWEIKLAARRVGLEAHEVTAEELRASLPNRWPAGSLDA